jgi:hypothetical protein
MDIVGRLRAGAKGLWGLSDLQINSLMLEAMAEIERLRAALAKKQEPEGGREERVAMWLRERGYLVTRAGGQDGS